MAKLWRNKLYTSDWQTSTPSAVANKVLLEHGCAHPFTPRPRPLSHYFSRCNTDHPAHRGKPFLPCSRRCRGEGSSTTSVKTTNAGAYPLHEQVHLQWVRGRPGALPPRDRAHHGRRGRTRDTTQAHACLWSRLLMTLGGGAPGRRANHKQRQDPAWKSLLPVSQEIPSSKGHPKPSYKCLDSGGACPQCRPQQGDTLAPSGSMVSTGRSVKASSTTR